MRGLYLCLLLALATPVKAAEEDEGEKQAAATKEAAARDSKKKPSADDEIDELAGPVFEEAMIVTASRQEESILDAPVSVTVVGQDKIEFGRSTMPGKQHERATACVAGCSITGNQSCRHRHDGRRVNRFERIHRVLRRRKLDVTGNDRREPGAAGLAGCEPEAVVEETIDRLIKRSHGRHDSRRCADAA